MTINEVFGLRNQGRIEEAYEEARKHYASDKSPYSTAAMFWTAVDMLKKLVTEGHEKAEARKIYAALERLTSHARDERGWMDKAMKSCRLLLEGEERQDQEATSPEHIFMGEWGEVVAMSYLRDHGYVILSRDWHSRHRDIDIIARQDDCVVFVEVKTRKSKDVTDPLSAIDDEKLFNLRQAINHYLSFRKIDLPWRLDIIGVVGPLGCSSPEIEHIQDIPIM